MTGVAERLSTALADRYRIERELGQGGMATVYLAHDLKHDRKVALKVLKPELAAVLGAERFVVEIRTTAALQHPHILPLFDSGRAEGRRGGEAESFLYYVMPYIEGETLRDKLNRETQLGIDEAVRIARDVLDALDYAHRHGVIHRDIKPENILLHDGRPMVADFGIALAVSAAAGGRMTETGLSLGTPHYMSPEQATAAKEISARSDIYSLASVLYEMLAGQPPHVGGSAQQVIMRIVTDAARPLTELRKSVPPNVAAAVAKALETLPADRFPTAAAFAEALANPSFARPGSDEGIRRGSASGDWRARVAIPALGLASLLALVVLWLATQTGRPRRVSRYDVTVPGQRLSEYSNLAVSPDGSHIVMARRGESGDRLFVRRREQLEAVELPGTEGGFNPSFSPEGDKVAFMSGATIRVADLRGGPVITVTDSTVGVPGLAWAPDGYLYFDRRGVGPLFRVRATGGSPEPASTLDTVAKELQHAWPDPLPNGRGVIMTVNRSGPGQGATETDGIAVLDLRTGRHRELLRGVFARYASSGQLLYVTPEGVLMGVPFDQDRLEVRGSPIALAEGLAVRAGTGSVDLSISRDGTLWYVAGGGDDARLELVWATREGRFSPVDPGVVGNILDAALSPDGSRLAIVLRAEDGAHVWIVPLGGGKPTRLTFERSFTEVTWSPDGRNVTAVASGGGLFTMAADGGAVPVPVPIDATRVLDARWSPDHAWLLYATPGAPTPDLYAIRPGVASASRQLVATANSERHPSLSPDGRWLLFQSARVARSFDVQVRPFPNTSGSLHQVSQAGGSRPLWSRDGREIFFQNRDSALVSVPVLPGPGFVVGPERVLFTLRGVRTWDVAPDGRRFLLVRERERAEPERLIVVENFFEELKAKVPR